MRPGTVDRLVAESLAIEAESAREAGTLGYLARAMVQATMPHRRSEESTHERVNGAYHLTMMAPPSIGLPYGSVPRLMLAWIGAEVLRTREREIVLGESMSAFMRELGMVPTGGRWGTVTRLKEQSRRLFGCVITCTYDDEDNFANGEPFHIGRADLWWHAQRPEQLGVFQSRLQLSDAFYDEILGHSVPVDMRVLQALRRSPLALDVYAWCSYRLHTLARSPRTSALVPWEALQRQFGAGYPETTRGRCDFRKAFLRELTRVLALHGGRQKITAEPAGLLLRQSTAMIPGRRRSPVCGQPL